MHILKPVLLGLGILGAILVGWMLHMSTAIAGAGDPGAVTQPGMQQPLLPAVSDEPPQVHITIVTPDAGSGTAQPPPDGTRWYLGGRARLPGPTFPTPHQPRRARRASSTRTLRPDRSRWTVQVDGLSVIANGNDIVIATDGAIIRSVTTPSCTGRR